MDVNNIKLDNKLNKKEDIFEVFINLKEKKEKKRTLSEIKKIYEENNAKRMKSLARTQSPVGLWCYICESRFPKDSFSLKQKRSNVTNENRYCLRHSTTSDFNRFTKDII
jgi:hypothetical protein